MSDSAIYEQLTQVFQDVFDDDELAITPDLTADDVEEWDSLSHIRLVLSVERAFKVKFSAAEVDKLKNVGDLVALIKAKQ